MACADCERALDHVNTIAPYRLGTATIALVGCREHVKDAMRLLTLAQLREADAEVRAEAQAP